MSAYQTISVTNDQNICIIAISREDKMNALNMQLLHELDLAMDTALESDGITGIIITGSGEKAFAAGADIAEFADFSMAQGLEMSKTGHAILRKIETSPKPVIAAVNGYALGGGCELSMACHMRVASDNARFGQPEVNLGIIAGYGGTQRLTALIGRGKALELLLTGDMIKADEALALGLVNHVVPMEQLMAKCKEILQKIATKGPLAVAKTIEAVNTFFDNNKNGLEEEMRIFSTCFNTSDYQEGTAAFLEKRKADFSGK